MSNKPHRVRLLHWPTLQPSALAPTERSRTNRALSHQPSALAPTERYGTLYALLTSSRFLLTRKETLVKLFSPFGCDHRAVPRLTIPFCAVLTALLFLTCASAKAQWTVGNTYYGVTTVTDVAPYTTSTKTASAGTATMSLNSVPRQVSGYDTTGYETSGSQYGYVYQDFVWGGGQGSTDLYYDSAETVSGNCSAGQSASSSLSYASGATSSPFTLSYSASSPRGYGGAALGFSGTPTMYTAKDWMQTATHAAGFPSSATAKATVVFGIHVFDPGP